MSPGQFLKSLEVTGSVWRGRHLRFVGAIRKTVFQQRLQFRGNVMKAKRMKLVRAKMASNSVSECDESLNVGEMGLGTGWGGQPQ